MRKEIYYTLGSRGLFPEEQKKNVRKEVEEEIT